MGRASAFLNYANLQSLLREVGTYSLRRLALPHFLLQRLASLDVFRRFLQNATNKIVENQNVITKVYFPRLILPFSATLSGLVDFGISFLMFVAIMVYYRVEPSWPILMLPVFLLLAVLTALGVGLWLSALNAIYREVRYVVPFLVQFWMFASPVVYPSSLVPAKWRWLYGLNPMAGVIEGFRWVAHGNRAIPRAACCSYRPSSYSPSC